MKHYGVDNIWKLSDYNKKCAELRPETHAIHMQKCGFIVFEIWESDMNKLNDEELSIYIINLLKNIKNDT